MNATILTSAHDMTWVSKTIMTLKSTQARTLYVYLLQRRSNKTLIFNLKFSEVAHDLRWDRRTLNKAFRVLVEAGLMTVISTTQSAPSPKAPAKDLSAVVKMAKVEANDSIRFVTSAIFSDGENRLTHEMQIALQYLLVLLNVTNYKNPIVPKQMVEERIARRGGISRRTLRNWQDIAVEVLPYGLVSVVDGFRGKTGTRDGSEYSIDWSVCEEAVTVEEPEIIPNTATEAVVAERPAVVLEVAMTAPVLPPAAEESTPANSKPGVDHAMDVLWASQMVGAAYEGARNVLLAQSGSKTRRPLTTADKNAVTEYVNTLRDPNRVEPVFAGIGVAFLGVGFGHDPENMLRGFHYLAAPDRHRLFDKTTIEHEVMDEFVGSGVLQHQKLSNREFANFTATDWEEIFGIIGSNINVVRTNLAGRKADSATQKSGKRKPARRIGAQVASNEVFRRLAAAQNTPEATAAAEAHAAAFRKANPKVGDEPAPPPEKSLFALPEGNRM